MENFWAWVSESTGTSHDGLVVHVAMEHAPFTKGGGLGDVVGALPAALHRVGLANIVICPFLPTIAEDLPVTFTTTAVFVGISVAVKLRAVMRHDVCCVFVEMDSAHSFSSMYTDERDTYDAEVDLRYFVFANAVHTVLRSAAERFWLVTHDWHGAAIHLYRHGLQQCRGSVHVIHNYHYQGEIFPDVVDLLDEDVRDLVSDSFAPTGRSSLSRIALANADQVVAVSRCYAEELRTGRAPHPNVDAAVARPDLVGITNGIDANCWSPHNNRHLVATYDRDRPENKQLCKQALYDELDLENHGRPLVLYMSRLTAQKGVDLFVDLRGGRRFEPVARLEELLDLGLDLLVVGTPQGGAGGPVDHQLAQLAEARPDGFRYIGSYTESLAHRALAGADVLLHPSRFEPCGLTQMYALAFGTVPVVTPVGGLRETVRCLDQDPSNGFGFHLAEYSHKAVRETLQDVVARYHDREGWTEIVRRAMAQCNDWILRAMEYRDLLTAVDLQLARSSRADGTSAPGLSSA